MKEVKMETREKEREEESTEKGRKLYTRVGRLSTTPVFGSQVLST